MREGVVVGPSHSVCEPRVIKTILRSLDAVDVEKDLNAVLLCGIHEPLDFVFGAVHAAYVRSVRLEGPVTDWESDHLNLASGQVSNEFLSNPVVPMTADDSVSLLGSKGFTEGKLVKANSVLVRFSEESVEERWSDPWLNDLPSSKVDSNHRLAI